MATWGVDGCRHRATRDHADEPVERRAGHPDAIVFIDGDAVGKILELGPHSAVIKRAVAREVKPGDAPSETPFEGF